jgi:uncharacterized protein (DUF58 family)
MSVQARRVSSLFVTAPVLLSVGVVLFPALIYGQRDLTILCFLVFGIIGSLRLWGTAGLLGVKCNPGLSGSRMFPGEQFVVHVRVENRKVLPVWVEVKVPVNDTGTTHSAEEVLGGERGILWYQATRFEWELTSGKRGVHRIGPVKVTSGDLFGFFPREKETEESLEVVVYPRLVPLKTLSISRRDFFGTVGAESPVKDPVYVFGTTDYYYGRPARFIHWKASARHHRLQEKMFESSGQEKILIVVDVDGFEGEQAIDPFERTLEAAASLAVQLGRSGFGVGVLTNGAVKGWERRYLRVTRSESQLSDVLELFARLEARSSLEMADLINRGLALPYGVSCIYFAFEETKNQRMAVERLKHIRVPVTTIMFKDINGLVIPGEPSERPVAERYDSEKGGAETA